MKNIELTKDHKSKLLEMCKKLFPEYILGFTNEIIDDGIMICHQGDWDNIIYIHWFEFCMTHLYIKICNQEYVYLYDFIYSNVHPVDYLYEQFLKLK